MNSSLPKKILILLSSAGGGHVAISQAINQYLSLTPKKYQVEFLDVSPALASPLYRVVGEYFQEFHQKNWQSGNSPKAAKLLHQLNSPLVAPKIAKKLKSFSPDLVISTSPFSIEEFALATKTTNHPTPHIIVIADPFTIHHTWTTYKQADHYLVPTLKTKQILINRSIPATNISLSGLPLRLSVYKPQFTQSKARNLFSLSPKKLTIFIGGSGEGHGQIYKLVQKLITHPQVQSDCQLIIVTGKNKLLKTRLDKLIAKNPTIKTFGYTNQIDQLLIASDIIVGKPGPNILFESLMLGKLFIATSKPLSQEYGNYQYISQKKLGFVTHKTAQTIEVILNLINHQDKIKLFSPAIQSHRQKYLKTPQKTLSIINRFLK